VFNLQGVVQFLPSHPGYFFPYGFMEGLPTTRSGPGHISGLGVFKKEPFLYWPVREAGAQYGGKDQNLADSEILIHTDFAKNANSPSIFR
jgi:hypothetical protein